MELKLRKLIANGALPKFDKGLEDLSNSEIARMDPMELYKRAGGNFSGITAYQTPDFSKTGLSDDALAAANKNAMASLPQKGGVGSFLKNNAAGIANTAMSALNFANTIGNASKNTMTADEMMGSGGQFENSANGISYQESRIDQGAIQDQINATASAATMGGVTSGALLGGSLGSLFGPLGTGIGTVAGGIIGGVAGLLGGKSAKREAERLKEIAINRTNAMNALNRETAYTIGLRNEFNRENRTDTSLSLFHAAKGKESSVNPNTGETYNDYIVNTAFGKVKAPQNAWVSAGEVIRSADGSLYRVPQTNRSGNPDKAMPRFAYGIASNKKFKADTERAHLMPGDSVYSNIIINPETGNTIADDAASYAMAGQLDRLDMNLNVGRMMKEAGRRKTDLLPGFLGGTNKYKCLPGFEGGTGFWGKAWKTVGNGIKDVRDAINQFGNIVDIGNITLLGNAYLTAAQRDARAEGGLRSPKSFVANPYEQDAIQQLNKLHSDYYPVWAQNRELEGRGKSSIMQSGGLSAGQKMLGYMGLTNQTQQNNASALFEHQGRENALRSQAAKASLEAGNQSATRQQQAYQWDEDMLAKAHAARENMLETSAYDRQNALESFFANKFKKNQFDRTMNLYESQQKNDDTKTKALIDSLNKPVQPAATAPVVNNPAAVAPQTVKQLQKMWENKQPYYDLGDLDDVEITPQKKIKPRTKRRITKKGGKK